MAGGKEPKDGVPIPGLEWKEGDIPGECSGSCAQCLLLGLADYAWLQLVLLVLRGVCFAGAGLKCFGRRCWRCVVVGRLSLQSSLSRCRERLSRATLGGWWLLPLLGSAVAQWVVDDASDGRKRRLCLFVIVPLQLFVDASSR
jgi:hypothetical protein